MQKIFKFVPIYKERPWGGQAISGVGRNRHLPAGAKIGESWEISDRNGDESIITEGTFKGKSIRWLMDEHGSAVMGHLWLKGQRFPLLIKLLDATERLSLQVHPPSSVALELKGEPKTEMWYLLGAEPHAAVLAGLQKGVERKDFEKALRSQTLEPLIRRIPVQKGDAIFIPSGRIHAIDAGCLILEIQQNSDTTYRVYDWGRVGLDGKPRGIHIEQSMRSINFTDFESALIDVSKRDGIRELVDCEHFRVEWRHLAQEQSLENGGARVFHILAGTVNIVSSAGTVETQQGETVLLAADAFRIQPINGHAEFIVAEIQGKNSELRI